MLDRSTPKLSMVPRQRLTLAGYYHCIQLVSGLNEIVSGTGSVMISVCHQIGAKVNDGIM